MYAVKCFSAWTATDLVGFQFENRSLAVVKRCKNLSAASLNSTCLSFVERGVHYSSSIQSVELPDVGYTFDC